MDLKRERHYTDKEWAYFVSQAWLEEAPTIDINQLKYFRRSTHLARAPKWAIGWTLYWENISKE